MRVKVFTNVFVGTIEQTIQMWLNENKSMVIHAMALSSDIRN